jgi:MerR family Zn(II)-responsive transcriptional regulator of zntA
MFTIGKLAALATVSNDTLRYYEQEGLISPTAKSAAGYRLYDQDSVRRIRFIKHAQGCGFTLAGRTAARHR